MEEAMAGGDVGRDNNSMRRMAETLYAKGES